eukprot:312149-Pelagomonas_calceolata.AAC.1
MVWRVTTFALPFLAGCRRIELASEYPLTDKPHALLCLSKAYALPTSMYACQIWGTGYLKEGADKDCPVQTVHSVMIYNAFTAQQQHYIQQGAATRCNTLTHYIH